MKAVPTWTKGTETIQSEKRPVGPQLLTNTGHFLFKRKDISEGAERVAQEAKGNSSGLFLRGEENPTKEQQNQALTKGILDLG